MTDAASTPPTSSELQRLHDSREWDAPWKKWGAYLSERQWGTVREDYRQTGEAWRYFPHDHARSCAYHWGKDGLAGFCDLKQRLCFAVALWNGKDPILKERLFGLGNAEGNHGEDVKEYYFYLDSTPTHSYMKWLYKYPQAAFPYHDLVATNARRTQHDFECELIDTGVFDGDRYFDVFVEDAKSSPEECFIRITVANRGPETATIHLSPTLWFRNTWNWWPGTATPYLAAAKEAVYGASVVAGSHLDLADRWLYCDGAPPLLFTENGAGQSAAVTLCLTDTPHALVATGRRPMFGGMDTFQQDPHWRDCVPFYEYFHGDNGAGLGASHQTGWTALVAVLAQMSGTRRCTHPARVREERRGRRPPRGRPSPRLEDGLEAYERSRAAPDTRGSWQIGNPPEEMTTTGL